MTSRLVRSRFGVGLMVLGSALSAPLSGAFAQDTARAWIQIEAQPSLRQATQAASGYARSLPAVNGFALGGRWYGIALGPYNAPDARALLRQLRASGAIPRDAFVSDGASYGQQFWPVGAQTGQTAQSVTVPQVDTAPLPATDLPSTQDIARDLAANSATGATGATDTEARIEAQVEEAIAVELPDETPAQARRSEAALDRAARDALQVALAWAGFYDGRIDGAFGAGTRASMAAWQAAQGYTQTGVLTTRERGELLSDYQAVLDALGMELVRDDTTGIAVEMPKGLVQFDAYAPPFARYVEKDGSGVQVLLISQTGDQATLGGLYEILQTLKIVPLDGERSLKNGSFDLSGADGTRVTYATAKLVNGTVKGFVLVWPAGDDKRRRMAMEAMKTSFAPISGAVLPDAYGAGAAQDIDLLAGLEIRRADRVSSGVYVDAAGHILTTAQAVAECREITLDADTSATLTTLGDGFALLTPDTATAPLGIAGFAAATPRLQSEVMVAGFPYEGRLGAATLNYGTLADTKGLNNEAGVLRLAMNAMPSEAGGPVLADTGAVVGLLADEDGARVLPEGVSFARDLDSITAFLSGAGVTITASTSSLDLGPDVLVQTGRDMAVMVSCWK
ncbi:serine protease [Aquimixticola soesokkakensis]|nr:serine protease [Aquimixticola soesokkakensis]